MEYPFKSIIKLDIIENPRYKKQLFGDHPVVRAPISMRSQAPPTPVAHHTRLRTQAKSSQQVS